jgi:hypothetical protein
MNKITTRMFNMSLKNEQNFPSIEELMRLSKEDPSQLDIILKRESEKIINNASTEESKNKLKGIQFQCNMIKEKNKNNSMNAVSEIFDKMWCSFKEMDSELQIFKTKNKELKKPKLTLLKNDKK